MSDFVYTEQTIQRALNGFFAHGSVKYNVDNLYVFPWESDKLLWTKSGYIHEFEIKISRADYKNDFKHKLEKHIVLSSTIAKDKQKVYEQDLFGKMEKKYRYWDDDDIKQHIERVVDNKRMPNYFYYAVPYGMIQVEEVPEYAGLIWVKENRLFIQKKAPCLHKEKYTDAQLNLGEKFYYNWVSTKIERNKALERAERNEQLLRSELEKSGRELSYNELKEKLEAVSKNSQGWMEDAAMYRNLYEKMQESADFSDMERKMLLKIIKKDNPNFNYLDFLEDVREKYKFRYPNRE